MRWCFHLSMLAGLTGCAVVGKINDKTSHAIRGVPVLSVLADKKKEEGEAAKRATAAKAPQSADTPSLLPIDIVAGDDINPSFEGEPGPVQLRFFALRDPRDFTVAGQTDLFAQHPSTMAENQPFQDVFLRPGERVRIDYALPDPHLRDIGVIANFRRPDAGIARLLIHLPRDRPDGWRLDVIGNRLVLTALSSATPKS